jgi:hypothetical protein
MSDEVKNDIAQKINRFRWIGLAICLFTLAIILFSSFSKYTPPFHILMPYSIMMLYGSLIFMFVGPILVLRMITWCYPSFLMKAPKFSPEIKMKNCLAGVIVFMLGILLYETVSITNGRGTDMSLMYLIWPIQIGLLVITKNDIEKETSSSGSQNKEDSRE